MTGKNIEDLLIKTFEDLQKYAGESPQEISTKTRPCYDLENFDSHRAIEATPLFCENLGFDLKVDVLPFVSDDSERALTIKEMAVQIQLIIGNHGKHE